jgi:thioredoxin
MTPAAPPGDEGLSAARTMEDADIEAALRTSTQPVVLAFTAEWCAPCKWLDPHLEALSETAAGRITIFRVDTDRSPGLARAYRVGSVPTVVLVRGGEEVERSVGVEPERLSAWGDRLLGESGGGARAIRGEETRG